MRTEALTGLPPGSPDHSACGEWTPFAPGFESAPRQMEVRSGLRPVALRGIGEETTSFNLTTTNFYVRTAVTTLQVNIRGPQASAQAVLVDNTNRAGATWSSYVTSNVVINLGQTEGWHEVWIGLYVQHPIPSSIWRRARFKLDLTPPALVFTSPAGSTLSQPMLQLEGYCDEPLSRLACAVSNAAGLFTDQMIFTTRKEGFDFNTKEFTTYRFEAYDLELTNGLNIITVQAVDMAGNFSTTNLAFTLVSDTNPPVVQIHWPQDGDRLSGETFTWRGWVDDYTATLTVTIVDEFGNQNKQEALVERNGHFWAEELPLNLGTNWLSLTAVDVWGNVTITNITVVKSDLILTIDPMPSEQLNNPTVTVSGRLSDSGYTVWVNGVKATDNGDGTWTAVNVPLPEGGPAVIKARAIPNWDNGGYGTGG